MPRQIDKLTDPKVKSAKPKKSSYRLSDGAGLYVQVMPNGLGLE